MLKLQNGNTARTKTKWHRHFATAFRTILGRDSLKNKRKRKQKQTTKGPDVNLKYICRKRERAKFYLKSKIICYYFEVFNTQVRKVL